MNALRRMRYAVTLLLIIMALFLTAESAFLTNVKAAPTITFAPTHAIPGTLITVTLAGFSGTTCTISGTPVDSASSCTIGGGVTFVVKQYAPKGTYTITVKDNLNNQGIAPFTVDGFNLVLTPIKGSPGTEVTFNLTNVPTYDTSCSVSSFPTSTGVVTVSGCAVSNGIGNGTFIVGAVSPGDYVIEVTACTGNNGCSPSAGDYAQQVFTVLSGYIGPFIQLSGVNGTLAHPVGAVASGPVGLHVSVSGENFSSRDTTCTISSPSGGSFIVNAGCSVFTNPFGLKNVTGSFVVGNVAEGQYVVQVTGSSGDFAQAVFNVTRGAFIQLGVNGIFVNVGQVASGPTGTHVSIEGSSFLPNDALNSATCSISSPSSGNVIASGTAGCAFFKAPNGFVNVTGSFTVGNVAEGQYVIRVSGGAGDSAQAVFNVTRGAFIQLSGLIGGFVGIGQVASGPTGTHVNIEGSNFLPNDALNSATCSISSPSGGNVIIGSACAFFKAPNGFVNVTGSFVVGNVAEGQYVIRVSGGAGDSAQAVFNVTAGAFIQLSGLNGGFVSLGQVASGPTGTHVSVTGSRFLPNDALNSATCSISSPSSGNVIASGSGACAFFKAPNGFVNVTGSFIVGNVNPGQYVIRVSGSAGDSAQAVFNVTSGPFIQLSSGPPGGFVSLGQVASGPIGTHVAVEGSNFLPSDTTCTLSSPSGGVLIGAACSTFTAPNGFKNVTGSFTIGNVLPGQYVIQVSGNGGDFAQSVFNVTVGAKISLSPATGPVGVHVLVNGTGFLPTDTTCTVTGPGSGIVIAGACSIQAGTGTPGGSFTVGNVLPGQYVIQVTGNRGDFAQAVFNVTMGAVIFLNPGSGVPGADINFTGTGFLPTDTSCIVSSPGSGAVLSGSAACAIRAGKGTVNGSFTIGNILPGQYLIQVNGNQGDFAQAVLIVKGGPSIRLTGSPGRIGDEIGINGTGFLPQYTTCTLESGPTNLFNPILPGSGAVAITVGTGVVNGSFIIGNVPPGQYVIQVTCTGGGSSSFAQTILNVIGGLPSIELFPTSAAEGSTVTVIAYGLSPSDTGCYLLSYNSALNTPDNNLITASTCSITAPQTAQGSFVVGPFATQNIPYNVTIRGTPVNDIPAWASFNVTADVLVTPPTGTKGSVFTFTGSGFESDATSCTAATIPVMSVTPSCFISAGIGQVAGSVTAPTTAVSGTYAIVVTDNTGATATGFFTVGTPSALLVLNPSSVQQSQPVGVAGTGFNPDDTTCTITAGTPAPWTGPGGTPPVCSISGGFVSGSFTVSNTASGGYYLITVTGQNPGGTTGDFAQNFLAVELQSTVTTYSTTSTTKTSSTSVSTTTTSVATSYSYSSTTVQTTGIFYTTYTHATLTTVSGPTSTTLSVFTTTTQTQTTVSITQTTAFTTVSCGPLPCGFAIGSQGINLGPFADNVGMLAVLLVIIPMLLRRLFS